MRRVMIVGQPGSGKSTLARALGRRAGLPVVHIDHILWQAGWVERSRENKAALCREAEAGERWVFEGNYSATWTSRAARADLLVWLDRPLSLRLWRVTRRLLAHLGRSRADMAEGCVERIGRNSLEFYGYIWRTRETGQEAIARLAAAAPCPVVRLRSDREVAAFLRRVPAGDSAAAGQGIPALAPAGP